jgi:hypothetical protein
MHRLTDLPNDEKKRVGPHLNAGGTQQHIKNEVETILDNHIRA